MPDLSTLFLFSAASLALTITPGPDMLLIASRSVSQGKSAGLLSAWLLPAAPETQTKTAPQACDAVIRKIHILGPMGVPFCAIRPLPVCPFYAAAVLANASRSSFRASARRKAISIDWLAFRRGSQCVL